MSRFSGGLLAAILFAILTSSVVSQDKPEPKTSPADKPATPASESIEASVLFHDGTLIRRASVREDISVVTRYGKLNVPISDIRRIEFGLHATEETVKKINELINRLGSEEFAEREKASQDLIRLGAPAVPALEKAARSTDKEVVVRAEAALKRLRDMIPEDRLRIKAEDVIHTRESVITGKIAMTSLKAQTEYFGSLDLPLNHLRSLTSMARGEAEVTLDGAKFGGPTEKWVDTGFRVEADCGLIITASGKMDLSPQQAGQVLAGPDGMQHRAPQGQTPGTLLGRIGERGPIFVVGSRYEGRPGREGTLYLRVLTYPGTAAPSGSYKVGLVTGPEVAVNARVGSAPATETTPVFQGFGAPGFQRTVPAPIGLQAPPPAQIPMPDGQVEEIRD